MNMHSRYFASARAIATGALVSTLVITFGGCNKTQDAKVAAPPAAATIGTVVDDSILTTKVKSALLANEDIKSLDIKVETNKGVVMLSGFANNTTQIERAITVAKGIEGVASVVNQFSLKEGAQTIGDKIDDSVITTKIKAALLADESMKSLDVAVITRNGEAQLSGFVNNVSQLSGAVAIARGVEGVTGVVNHMVMKR